MSKNPTLVVGSTVVFSESVDSTVKVTIYMNQNVNHDDRSSMSTNVTFPLAEATPHDYDVVATCRNNVKGDFAKLSYQQISFMWGQNTVNQNCRLPPAACSPKYQFLSCN